MSRALLLVGSPKPRTSASLTFAEALGARLQARGWECSTERVVPALRDETRMAGLLAAADEADLVVLAFPVYVDSLPAPVLALLEAWAERGPAVMRGDRLPRLAVLAQCGFPEASHCDVAIEVCRLFAARCGLDWSGALAFGMGGAIEGRAVESSPLAGRTDALDAAADALDARAPIPRASTEAFARPLTPPWTYPLMGGLVWSLQARKRGCEEPLRFRRYAQ
jgi:NAD(P)H-dependent FMN reductase